jgi:hypothetical protein
MRDSYILLPTFFVGKKLTLIMGETGDELGTWEIQTFQVVPNGVTFLGTLDAAKRSTGDPACWLNPISQAKIERRAGEYVIQIAGELYLHPDTKNQEKLQEGRWHVFILKGKAFIYQR